MDGRSQRWKFIFLRRVRDDVEYIKNLMSLDNFCQILCWIWNIDLWFTIKEYWFWLSRTDQKLLPNFLLLSNIVKSWIIVLNRFWGIILLKTSKMMILIKSSPASEWNMCSKIWKACSPNFGEALIDHFHRACWVRIMKRFAFMIEIVSGRVKQFILIKEIVEMHFRHKKWNEV